MPIILPTADEIAAMDWSSRDKALRRARALLKDYAYAERLPRLHRVTQEQRESNAAARAFAEDAWGEAERETARAMLAAMPVDVRASEHRAAVAT